MSLCSNIGCWTEIKLHFCGDTMLCLYCVISVGWGREWDRKSVFIENTTEQLRGLCSLDTPYLFINIPLTVTLLF